MSDLTRVMPKEHIDLAAQGINLTAVFNVCDLPTSVLAQLASHCGNIPQYKQLLLFAHGGTQFWDALQRHGMSGADPVDAFTVACLQRYFAQRLSGESYAILYPGTVPVNLQALGTLAGWHHDSPFMVGVNSEWGSWFAYRALVLADTEFSVTPQEKGVAPCLSCDTRPCISACPAKALENGQFALNKCMAYRQQVESQCQYQCLARLACPIAPQHRYCAEQIHYHYSVSMQAIETYYKGK